MVVAEGLLRVTNGAEFMCNYVDFSPILWPVITFGGESQIFFSQTSSLSRKIGVTEAFGG